jgi:hypothetical protein
MLRSRAARGVSKHGLRWRSQPSFDAVLRTAPQDEGRAGFNIDG